MTLLGIADTSGSPEDVVAQNLSLYSENFSDAGSGMIIVGKGIPKK